MFRRYAGLNWARGRNRAAFGPGTIVQRSNQYSQSLTWTDAPVFVSDWIGEKRPGRRWRKDIRLRTPGIPAEVRDAKT